MLRCGILRSMGGLGLIGGCGRVRGTGGPITSTDGFSAVGVSGLGKGRLEASL